MRSSRLSAALAVPLVVALAACSSSGTPGGKGVGDEYFPKIGNGGYDAKHYSLDLDYNLGGQPLTGRADITATATKDLSAFSFDLLGMTVHEVTVDGHKAGFKRDGQELTVRPNVTLEEGTTFHTVVSYSGKPEKITDPDESEEGWLPTDDGALALGEPTGSMAWFPGNHTPSDKASYDVRVSVPDGLEAVSNGELTKRSTAGGRTTFNWHTAQPMASYVAMLAIGKYDIKQYKTPDGLPVYTAVDPSQADASKDVLAQLPDVMAWETKMFGPFPFSSTGAVVDKNGASGYALETQNRPVFPGSPSIGSLVHEMSHEWYGDSVTPKSWRDMWLNEGFATYAGWLWGADHGGDSVQAVFDRQYAKPADDAVWSFPPGKPSGADHISDAPVYQRGAMVLHEIRKTIGDAKFFALLKSWPASHRYGNADTADFTKYVEQQNPDKNLKPVWDVWLYGKGKPAHP
ncbi:M1 family metallopeptidase [Streptomyces sp. NPDC046821]|uniref:M1 family metallopeptidase n=1 Tax=Streptomyces sp. NPDC046821 TaxID=3154702 RepID=UPI0033ECA0DC